MSEIIIKVQLDLSDAVKEFMAALLGGCGSKANPLPVAPEEPEAEAPKEAQSEPEAEPEAKPEPPQEVKPAAQEVSREDIRALVKRILIGEKEADIKPSGVKAILSEFGANNVTNIREEDFVKVAAKLTDYRNQLPAF